MKTFKHNLLLLLALWCSLCAYAQIAKAQTAEEQLRHALDNVRSIAKSQTSPLAEIVKQYFQQHPSEPDFTSPDFEKFVGTLVNEKNKLPANKRLELAKAVDDLKKQYDAYAMPTAGNESGPPIQASTPKSTGTVSQIRAADEGNNQRATGENDKPWELVDYLVAGATVLAALVVVGILVYSLITLLGLRRATDEYFVSMLPKSLSGVKARQDELAKQIQASAEMNKDINQRLGEVHTEIRLMSRMLQQATLSNNRLANSPASYLEAPATPVSDLPVFPIAADELLRQMHGKTVIVKRDFQNDMLVSDPDGKGELVLIRDARISDEVQPLFIVPSVTQFQMRQEYYNFYEKYYDCANPESGAVWILDPAVVEKVAGGWQLREKGVLEVR